MEYISLGANTLQSWLGSLISRWRRMGRDRLTPSQVVMRWNRALVEGDHAFVEAHTYLTTEESKAYLQRLTDSKKWTSLKELSELYQRGPAVSSISFVLSEQIDLLSFKIARVRYEVLYEGGKATEFEDILVKEEGIWKMRLEHVRTKEIRDSRL